MKTIYEYLVNNHIKNTSLSETDICDIFNGDTTRTSAIKSCSCVLGSLQYKNENHKWTEAITTLMIIIYLNEISLDPDYVIMMWSGAPSEVEKQMKRFVQTVYKEAENHTDGKCSITKDNLLHFSETPHNQLRIYKKGEYKDLQIYERL